MVLPFAYFAIHYFITQHFLFYLLHYVGKYFSEKLSIFIQDQNGKSIIPFEIFTTSKTVNYLINNNTVQAHLYYITLHADLSKPLLFVRLVAAKGKRAK